MSKRFVVTGCNGYIGSHMCYELRKAYPDCHITGVDKVEKQHLRSLYDLFIHTDLAVDSFSLPEGDATFHFAAYISVEEGEREPLKYFRNNVVGSIRCYEQSVKSGIKNFIFSSTAAVYGESKSKMFGHLMENQPLNAFSVYGKTKQMVEEILSYTTGTNVACLRYFNAAGRNVEANLYEEHDPETHLIPLLAKNKSATIYGNDWPTKDGTCVRDYVHVIDVCSAHLKAYHYLNHFDGCQKIVLNVGSGKGYTVKEVIDKANKILHNGEMIVRVAPRRDGDVPYLVADTTKINSILNFKSEYTLDDILESMKEK